MTLKKRKKLYALLEQWTRCECISRFAPFGWPDCGDYFFKKLKKEKQIRKLMFGTGDLLELGEKWNLPGCGPKKNGNTEKKQKKRKKVKGKKKGQA
jgi:hypothetical protein